MCAENVLKTYREIVYELRKMTKAKITDEALLTYVLKSCGNLDEACEKYFKGPWSRCEINEESDVEEKKASGINKTTGCDNALRKQQLNLLYTEDSTVSHINKSKMKFTSLAPTDTDCFGMGCFLIDLTSSCRIEKNELEKLFKENSDLKVNFSVVPSKASFRKPKNHAFSKINKNAAGFPFNGTNAEIIKDNIVSQIFLQNRYLGSFPQTTSVTLGNLVRLDCIRIKLQLGDSIDNFVQIGSSIPVFCKVYLTSKALSPSTVLLNKAHEGLQDSWSYLIFNLLKLQPSKASMLSSSAPSEQDNSEDYLEKSAGCTTGSVTSEQEDISSFTEEHDATEDVDSRKGDDESADIDLKTCEEELPLAGDSDEANSKTNEVILNTYIEDSIERKDLPLLHPAVFRSTLRNYQLEGFHWMQNQETPEVKINESGDYRNSKELPDHLLHPLWDEFEIPQITQGLDIPPLKFYFSRTTGVLTKSFPLNTPQCLGGILADEMGLGKTVQTIALLSCEFNPTEEERRAYCMAWSNENDVPGEESNDFRSYLLFLRQQSSAMKRHLYLTQTFADRHTDPVHVECTLERLTNVKSKLLGGTLLILPLSLMSQWKRELDTHLTPGLFSVVEFYGRLRPRDPVTLTTGDIVLTTYGMVGYEFAKLKKKKTPPAHYDSDNNEICPYKQSPLWLIHWRRVVLDEAHMVKCHTTKISEAVCTLSARFRWCLTGTPIQNSVEDVFSLLRFLKVDPWGTWSWWYKTIVKKIQTHRMHEAIIAVRRILHSIILRRTKETRTSCGELILTLPEKKEYIVRLSLSSHEQEFYDAVYRRVSTQLDALVQSGNAIKQTTHVLELLLRLRQSACHPMLIYSASSTKVLRSLDNISELMTKYLKATGRDNNTQFLQDQIEKLRDIKNNQVDCPICRETPTDPAIGPCCHVFCRSCILSALNVIHPSVQWPCAVCRVPIKKEDIRALPGASRTPQTILKCLFDEAENFQYSSKLTVLRAFLSKDMLEGCHVVVFSQWTSFLDIVQIMFKHLKFSYRRFDGQLSLQQRDEALIWFRNKHLDGEGKILLISLRAGGVGLNLTVATRCYLLDPWWNPAVESQAIQRIHRLGQMYPVKIYRLIVERTVEERILQLQAVKKSHARSALERESANKTKMGNDAKLKFSDILKLFKEFNN